MGDLLVLSTITTSFTQMWWCTLRIALPVACRGSRSCLDCPGVVQHAQQLESSSSVLKMWWTARRTLRTSDVVTRHLRSKPSMKRSHPIKGGFGGWLRGVVPHGSHPGWLREWLPCGATQGGFEVAALGSHPRWLCSPGVFPLFFFLH